LVLTITARVHKFDYTEPMPILPLVQILRRLQAISVAERLGQNRRSVDSEML
jgi:hypothetical protein